MIESCWAPFSEHTNRKSCCCNVLPAAAFLCVFFFIRSNFVSFEYRQKVSIWGPNNSTLRSLSSSCKSTCTPSGSEPLPKGIVRATSNLEMCLLWDSPSSPKIEVNIE